MADKEKIDTISIEIESDAQKAADGIDRMVGKLIDLEKATAKTESGLSRFANMFRGFSNSFKNLDNISKSIKPLKELTGKTSMKLDTGNVMNGIDSISKEMKRLTKEENALPVSLKKQILALERQNIAYDAQKKKIGDLKAGIEELSAQKIPTEPYAALIRKIGFLEENLKNTIGIRDDLVLRGWSGEKIEKYNAQIEKSAAKLREFQQQQEQMEASGAAFEHNDLGKLTAELEIAEKRLQQIGSELGLNFESLSSNISNFAAESKKTKNLIDSFKNILKDLPIAEVKLKDPGKLESQITKLESRWEELKAKLQRNIMTGKITPDLGDVKYRDALVEITKVEKTIEATRDKLASLGNVSGSFDKLANNSQKAGKTINRTFSGVFNIVKKLGNSIEKFLGKAFRSLGKLIKNAVSSMGKLAAASKKSTLSFKGIFGEILKISLGMNVLRKAFTSVTQGFSEGLKNLVRYSGEVNHSVSLMTSALGALKNALAVAFSPIVSIVAPYITKFINMMTDAFNAVGMFFSALTGKKITVQASKFYKDYASSIAGVGDAAEDAGKALHTLGIDELNILSENKSSAGGGGSADIPVEDMFTDIAIEGAIADWAKKIRDAVLNNDWEGLGRTVAEMMNKGLEKVYKAINDATPKVEQAIKNFSKAFNEWAEYFDFELLGRTIGAGVNLITNSINTLFGEDGIDFKKLGKKLSIGLRGLVDEIKWRELGNALGNSFMVSWRTLDGFVTDMARKSDAGLSGWQELGIAVGDAINGIFEKIELGRIGSTIARLFNGIFEWLKTTTKTIKWGEIADNIIAGINNFISDFKWSENGKALNDFITDLLDTLLKVAEGSDWEGLGKGIGDFLSQIEWKEHLDKVAKIISEVLGGLLEGLGETPAGQFMISLVKGFMTFKFAAHVAPLATKIAGFFIDVFKHKAIKKAITDGINEALGEGTAAAGKSSVFGTIGAITAGIAAGEVVYNVGLSGITDLAIDAGKNKQQMEGLKESYTGILGPVKAAGSAIGLFRQKLEGLPLVLGDSSMSAAALDEAMKQIQKGTIYTDRQMRLMQETWKLSGDDMEMLRQAMLDANPVLLDVANSLGKYDESAESLQKAAESMGLLEKSASSIQSLKNKTLEVDVFTMFDNIFDDAKTAIEEKNWGLLGTSIVEGILFTVAAPVISIIDVFGDFFSWVWENICSVFGINSPAENMKPLGGYILMGIIEGFRDKFAEFGQAVSEWYENHVKVWFTKDKWSEIYDTIKTSLQDKWNEVVEWWNNLAIVKWWNDSVKPWFEKKKWSEIYENIKTSLQETWQSVVDWWNNLAIVKWWNDSVKPWFTKEKWGELYNTIRTSLEEKWNELVEWWENSALVKWWNEKVAPWFTKKKWSDLYDTVKTSLQDKWNGLSDWWEKSAVGTWWREKVQPWFSKQKWSDLYDTVKSGLQDKWNDFLKFWEDNGVSRWIKDKVAPFFEPEKWNFSGIKEGLGKAWNSAVEFVKGIWNDFAKWLNDKLHFQFDGLTLPGGKTIGAFDIDLGKIPTFADGGLIMNHMVAEIGEYGRREAILPLENRKSMSMIADSILSNYYPDGMIGNNEHSDELLQEQNALLREQNNLLAKIANIRPTAVLDTRDTLSGLRAEALREGYVF